MNKKDQKSQKKEEKRKDNKEERKSQKEQAKDADITINSDKKSQKTATNPCNTETLVGDRRTARAARTTRRGAWSADLSPGGVSGAQAPTDGPTRTIEHQDRQPQRG